MPILAATSVSFRRKRRRHSHASRYSTRTSPRPRERGLLVPSSTLKVYPHRVGTSTLSIRVAAVCASQGDPHNSRNRLRSRQLMKAPPHAEYLTSQHVKTAGSPAPSSTLRPICSLRLDFGRSCFYVIAKGPRITFAPCLLLCSCWST